VLVSASYRGLRVSLRGAGITARGLLTGDLGGQPLVGVVHQPGRPRDLVGTYWAGVYLVSERFRRCMSDLGASGWFTTPVQVEGVQSQLWLLSISGRCGPLFGVGGDPYPVAPTLERSSIQHGGMGLTSSWPITTIRSMLWDRPRSESTS
jgi:hypothetical protein